MMKVDGGQTSHSPQHHRKPCVPVAVVAAENRSYRFMVEHTPPRVAHSQTSTKPPCERVEHASATQQINFGNLLQLRSKDRPATQDCRVLRVVLPRFRISGQLGHVDVGWPVELQAASARSDQKKPLLRKEGRI